MRRSCSPAEQTARVELCRSLLLLSVFLQEVVLHTEQPAGVPEKAKGQRGFPRWPPCVLGTSAPRWGGWGWLRGMASPFRHCYAPELDGAENDVAADGVCSGLNLPDQRRKVDVPSQLAPACSCCPSRWCCAAPSCCPGVSPWWAGSVLSGHSMW